MAPLGGRRRDDRVGFDERPFGVIGAGLEGRAAIPPQPQRQPDDHQERRHEECRAPAEPGHQEQHDERRADGADIGTGVEDARRGGALLLREPLGGRLNGGGEVAGFKQAQEKAGESELKGRVGEGRAQAREGPANHGQGVAEAGADLVDHGAHDQEADAVGERKDGID